MGRSVAVAAALAVTLLLGSPTGATGPAGTGRPREATGAVRAEVSVSAGPRTLRVSRSQGLAAAGETIGVSGSGYDATKGIYVALCVVTPPGQAPSPCGGGADRTGSSGASAWISSDPPPYAQGLTTPYGPGGTFSVNIPVAAVIADGFDCRRIQCAVVTRNDHTRAGDRGQDVAVPVSFADVVPGSSTTAPPADTAPPTTIAPPPPPSTTAPEPAPATVLSDDGLTGTVGARSVTLSAGTDLDPAGTSITVDGRGFDPAVAVQVTLCRAAGAPSGTANGTDGSTGAPGPCRAGASPDASRVVAPEPAGSFVAFDPDGSFSVEVEVAAEIDAATDCREVACAVVVRRYAVDDADMAAAAADRSLDVVVPVGFAAVSPPEPDAGAAASDEEAAPVTVAAEPTGDDDGGSAAVWVVAVVLAGLAAAVGAVVVRSRRSVGA